jgi:hypothetical protein
MYFAEKYIWYIKEVLPEHFWKLKINDMREGFRYFTNYGHNHMMCNCRYKYEYDNYEHSNWNNHDVYELDTPYFVSVFIITKNKNNCITIDMERRNDIARLCSMSYCEEYENVSKQRFTFVNRHRRTRYGTYFKGENVSQDEPEMSNLFEDVLDFLKYWKKKYFISKIVSQDLSFIPCHGFPSVVHYSDYKMIVLGKTYYGKYGFLPWDNSYERPNKKLLRKYISRKKIINDLRIDNTDILRWINTILNEDDPHKTNIITLLKKHEYVRSFMIDLSRDYEVNSILIMYIIECLFCRKLLDKKRLTSYYLEYFYLDISQHDSFYYDPFYRNRFNMLEKIKGESLPFELLTDNHFKYAILNGNLCNIKWLFVNGCSWNKWSFSHLSESGNLYNMKWALKNGCKFDSKISCHPKLKNLWFARTFNSACENGNLENMKWLLKKGCPFNKETFSCASGNGNLENMKWMLKKGFPWDGRTFFYACQNGNLDNMKWLLKNGCPFDSSTFSSACSNGNLKNIKWLLKNGCRLCSWTFGTACFKGILKNMKWLYKNGCPISEFAWHNACSNGNLDNMKWLKKIRCPWDKSTFRNARDKRIIENLIWLRDNGCPYDESYNHDSIIKITDSDIRMDEIIDGAIFF